MVRIVAEIGNDLYIQVKVSLHESLCGFTKTIVVYRQKLNIISPVGTVIGNYDIRCVENEGYCIPGNVPRRGRLYIQFRVIYPKVFMKNDMELIRDCFGIRDYDIPINAEERELIAIDEYYSELEKQQETEELLEHKRQLQHQQEHEELYEEALDEENGAVGASDHLYRPEYANDDVEYMEFSM